jgi:hypothetical protein
VPLAQKLRQVLPPSIEVQAVEGHLYIYRPEIVSKIIAKNPATYPGRNLLEQVHQASIAGNNGELLGFGPSKMLQPGSVLVRIYDEHNSLRASFWTLPELAEKLAMERTLDFTLYFNRPFYNIITKPAGPV